MHPVGRLIHIQFPRDLICSRLEFLNALAEAASDLRNTFSSKNEQNGQEYEDEFERSQASHDSTGSMIG